MAVPVLTLVSALALGACGGSGSDSDSGSSGDSKGKPDASAAPEKTSDPAAELKSAVLSKSEVKGFTVREPQEKYVFATSQDNVKLDKAVCAPIAYATNQLPLGSPKADLTRVAAGAKGPGVFTYVTLSAYERGEAKATLAELSKAIGSCGNGFTAKAGRTTSPYSSVTAETAPTPKGADESVAFNVTTKFENVTHTLRARTVRYGDTLALYYAVDAMAFTQARPGNPEIATAVMDAQNAKLV
ncbi:hypothetical protein GKQ77_13850 [Streptomyces sp. BG9H]|uniref:PknH-like extracellular domain-containing protein n=1 Tax=Streptomyces anatolicus TaxID=2675858 RepID=A0ABS6YMJ1_9ACTN|nr:hypothetical protein [Streptomyces anatolicus]